MSTERYTNMANFEELKILHNRKLEQAQELACKLSINLINRDLEYLVAEMPERLKKTGVRKYVLDEKIYLSIGNTAVLEIEDRRGSAFLWGFEIDFSDKLRLGDLFEHSKKVYSVRDLYECSFQGAKDVLQQIVNSLDDTLSKLRNSKDPDQWAYRYYSAHEDIFCEAIRDVVETVVKRKP